MAEDKKKEKKLSIKPQDPKKYIELEPKLDTRPIMGEDQKLSKKAKEILDAALEEDESLDEDYLEEKIRPMSFAERIKRAQTMRRFASKIELAKERAANRRASPEKIRARARKRALDIIRARILKNKHYADLPVSEKIAIDKRLQGIPQSTIDRIAKRQIQSVKKAEAERIQKRMHHTVSTSASSTGHKTTNEAFEDYFGFDEQDLNTMFEDYMEGRLSFDGQDALDESTYKTKRPHTLFNKEGTVKFDGRFKLFRKKVNESADYDIGELADFIESMEEVEEGLASDRIHRAIQAEKEADRIRHQRMLDTAKRTDERRKQLLQREGNDYTKSIADRELKHKALANALKDYASKVKDMKYEPREKKEAIAKKIIDKYAVKGFSHRDLMNLNRRVKTAKHYEKAWSNFDAWESYDPATNKPSDREWGTDSLTKTYKKATPGQHIEEAEKPKGLWYNIHQRRKKGLRPLRPGEKGYPKTLDIEETVTGGFTGKVNTPNVKVRMADGSIRNMPAPKSASSKDGGE